MTGNRTLLDLQKRQNDHDKHHHPDIYNTSYPARMNHYVLHFSKYVGRLSRDYETKSDAQEELNRTLADCFIVALASANTLNLDLRNELEYQQEGQPKDISQWCEDSAIDDGPDGIFELQEWLFANMAKPTGRMSNAMESLDHMESMDVRQSLENGTIEIVSDLLTTSSHLDVDLVELTENRWDEIEQDSIL